MHFTTRGLRCARLISNNLRDYETFSQDLCTVYLQTSTVTKKEHSAISPAASVTVYVTCVGVDVNRVPGAGERPVMDAVPEASEKSGSGHETGIPPVGISSTLYVMLEGQRVNTGRVVSTTN